MDLVTLSRLQFAVTALYHFLFVPLTLGLSVLLGIMRALDKPWQPAHWRTVGPGRNSSRFAKRKAE